MARKAKIVRQAHYQKETEKKEVAGKPFNVAQGRPSSLVDTRVIYCGDNAARAKGKNKCFYGVTIEKKFFIFFIELLAKVRYTIISKPVGPLPQGILSLGGCFFRYSTPAGPLPQGTLTSAGLSFYRGGKS